MMFVALEPTTLPAFFYLDLVDARRRAALLTLAAGRSKPTLASLNCEYAQALAQISKAPLNAAGKPRVVSGGPILRVARTRHLVDGSVNSSTYSAESRAAAIRSVQHGLLFLRLQHPPLRELCDLLITDILVWPSVKVGGGSSAKLPGIAWFVLSANLTSLDIAETVVHEMVHLNLHLADMTFGLYTHAPGTEFEAYSAVLGRRRPYHHAFHSACVAVAVIYFRLLFGLDAEIGSLRSSLRRCTSELLRHRAAFAEYAWEAILAAHAFSRAPEVAAIPVHEDLTRARGVKVGI
jgi:hypothetical protein